MLRPSQSSNGASVYTLFCKCNEGPYPNCVSSKGHQTWYPSSDLIVCKGIKSCQLVKLKAPWDV